jgi:hypothetical protein
MKLYICGDSFCVNDTDFGDNWVNLLTNQYPNLAVVNLASCGASNYLIYLQVKQALEDKCNFLIYNATSSVRQEFSVNSDNYNNDSIKRYWNVNNQSKDASMICGSWLGIDRHYKEIINSDETNEIHNFFKKYVDLPSLIEKNFIFVLHTLTLLESSDVKWAWSQGGFEHKNFSFKQYPEFNQYRSKECSINLWDYYVRDQIRPWFHVTDPEIHQNACKSYADILKLDI